MPFSAERILLDTSVAVPLVVDRHEHHEAMLTALGRAELGLAGHAAFETFSVLTRLPAPLRRGPGVIAQVLASSFPATLQLSSDEATRLLAELATLEIAGGSVFDALVGACAREHALPLVSRDRRAAEIYRLLDVDVQLLT